MDRRWEYIPNFTLTLSIYLVKDRLNLVHIIRSNASTLGLHGHLIDVRV